MAYVLGWRCLSHEEKFGLYPEATGQTLEGKQETGSALKLRKITPTMMQRMDGRDRAGGRVII